MESEMKKVILLLILLTFTTVLCAHNYEIRIRAHYSNDAAARVSVKIFYLQNNNWQFLTVNNVPYIGYTATTYNVCNAFNGGCDVEGVSEIESGEVLFPAIPYSIATQGIKLVINGRAVDWHNEYQGENTGDTDILYNVTTGFITIQRPGFDTTVTTGTAWMQYVAQVKNSFDGGQIQFNNDAPETIPSGAYLTKVFSGSIDDHTVTALPNQTAANYYVWNNWSSIDETLTINLPVLDCQRTANFLPAERLVFQDVPVIIEQTTTAAANTTYKAKLNYEINITLNSDVFNSMLTTFVCWNKNGTYYGNTRAITYIPTAQQITTFSVSRDYVSPVNSYRNQHYGTTVGQPITIYWSEHPLSNVSYQIWRRVRHNGVTGSAALLDTLSHGTTSYIDYDYLLTSSYTDDLLFYDVRAVYSVNSSTSAEDYIAVYGAMDVSKQSDDNAMAKTAESISITPTEYSLVNYPNPFNPTTVIRYTMPEAGQVSLKVYNILSQEVANLVESNQSAGVHQVNFNASHLPTGIYIARLQAGAKVMTAKLQLVK
jgi:hypothetical protein